MSHTIRCSCLPEMKKDTIIIFVRLDRVGNITQANSRLGPSGHIAALCCALKEFCRIKLVRQPESCTSHLQKSINHENISLMCAMWMTYSTRQKNGDVFVPFRSVWAACAAHRYVFR